MKELQQSIKIVKKYNEMPFDDFVKLVEQHIGKQIPTNIKDSFRFTGLSNIDFFKMYVE